MKQGPFEAQHAVEWREFEAFTEASGSKKAEPPFDLAEMPERYRRLCQSLALAADRQYSPELVDRLNHLALRGHHALYAERGRDSRQILDFLTGGFPALVRREWRLVLISALVLIPFIIPPIVFYITRRWCIGLQRADRDLLLHGYETGIIMRSPEGGYSERHLPISEDRAYTLTARHRDQIHEIESEVDENGVRAPGSRVDKVRAKLSRGMFADNIQKPTVEELEEAKAHAEHEHELESGLDHPASGHEFDDHQLRDAEDVPLRGH